MESGFIEFKVISCKDLRAFNFFQKLCVYVLVSITSDDNKKLDQKQQQRTATDREGDANPEWNHPIRFELSNALLQDCDDIFIHFDLRLEGLMFADKSIGEVRVPLKDLIQESNGAVRFVIYEIRTTDGKSNGILNFSYEVNGIDQGGLWPNFPTNQIAGYPIIHHHHHPPEPQFSSSEAHSGSPRIHYPLLDVENTNQGGPQLPSSPYANHDPSKENFFVSHDAYYQYSPPPPPPPFSPLMPPSPWGHGPYCHHQPPPPPPPPPGPSPWDPNQYGDAYVHSHWYSPLGPAPR